MKTTPSHRPSLGIFDPSDVPSGLSRYLQLLWPAITEQFRVTVLGDPDGPYSEWPNADFVPLPARLRNRGWESPVEEATSTRANLLPFRTAIRSMYRRLAPVNLRFSLGFIRDTRLLVSTLKPYRFDAIYMPICDIEYAPLATWLANIPGRVGVFHLAPGSNRSLLYRLANRFVMSRVSNLIAVSQNTADGWGKCAPALQRRISVIPNGVVTANAVRSQAVQSTISEALGIPPGRRLWLAAGRLSHMKGFLQLVDAVAMLRERHPDLMVLIAGEGSLRQEIETRIVDRGIGENVRLLGHIRHMESLFSIVDGFVLSSVNEAMPFVLLEAMSHGLPVVATNVGGVAELVQDGVNGVLLPANSPEQIASGIERCLANPQRALEMGLQARHTVNKSYSVEAMRSQTIDVIRSAVSRS